jgi:sugar/nucleoside kinase (ribokinase family)
MKVMSVGSINVDILAVDLPEVAAPGRVVYARREIEARIAGHPIDIAIALAELGADAEKVAVVAAIGDGIYGSHVRSVMDGYELTTFLQAVTDRDTGKNIVLEVTGEDRRFHIDPGANWLLDVGHVVAALDAWRPDVVTLRPGYTGIDLDLDAVLSAVEGALVFLDIMQPHPSRPADYLEGALRHADIVHCNQIEARVATGAATVDEAVAGFFSHGVDLALITAGDKGVTAYTPTHRITQRGFVVDVVDVTGSGDAFCAGFIHGLGKWGDPTDPAAATPELIARMLLSGQAVGASAATAVGCVEGISASLIGHIIAEQGEELLDNTEIHQT